MVLVVCVAVALGCAAVPFVVLERRWRWRWQEVEIGRLPVERTALYREGGSVPVYLRRAPGLLRAAVLSCFLFGQLCVPFAAIALAGLVYYGFGFAMVPLLVVTAQLHNAGRAALRRDPGSAGRLREAARWALWLYGLLLPFALASGSMLFGAYALSAFLQALFCRVAVTRCEDALQGIRREPDLV